MKHGKPVFRPVCTKNLPFFFNNEPKMTIFLVKKRVLLYLARMVCERSPLPILRVLDMKKNISDVFESRLTSFQVRPDPSSYLGPCPQGSLLSPRLFFSVCVLGRKALKDRPLRRLPGQPPPHAGT